VGSDGTTANRRHWLAVPLAALASLVAAWALLFIVIPTDAQDFPLNDDWAFARGAVAFARGEGVHYLRWASMPQLGQWLWAWPFLELLGESHTTLRFTTVVLSLLGVAAFFDLLRQAGLAPGRAAFVAACLAFNPLYFELSGTFLTDVPTLAFSLIALALYGRAFALAAANALGAFDLLAAAVVVAVLGAITRQNAITVPIAAGLLLLLRYPRLRLRPAWLLAVAVPGAAALAAHFWLKTRPDYYAVLPKDRPDLGRLVLVAFTGTHYLGLTALPVLFFEADWRFWKRPAVLAGLAVGLLAMGAGAAFYGLHESEQMKPVREWWKDHASGGYLELFKEDSSFEKRFPYLGNMLTPYGQFGSKETVLGDRPLILGPAVRVAVSVVGCVAGAALLVSLVARLRAGAWKEPLTLFTALHLPFLFLPYVIFDRYYLVLMPGALYLATNPAAATEPAEARRGLPRRALGLAALGLYAVVSVALLHDWLSWNAARWELGRRAVERGIEATDIEGGFEWNGWYSPYPVFARCRGERKGLTLTLTWCMYAHISGRYGLSFSVLDGTRAVDEEPYDLWLAPGRRSFYLIATQAPGNAP
jgi:hypothetical protein